MSNERKRFQKSRTGSSTEQNLTPVLSSAPEHALLTPESEPTDSPPAVSSSSAPAKPSPQLASSDPEVAATSSSAGNAYPFPTLAGQGRHRRVLNKHYAAPQVSGFHPDPPSGTLVAKAPTKMLQPKKAQSNATLSRYTALRLTGTNRTGSAAPLLDMSADRASRKVAVLGKQSASLTAYVRRAAGLICIVLHSVEDSANA